ncbi:MAG: DNA topoisomerase IB, partial [Longimicrobiales bacterium]
SWPTAQVAIRATRPQLKKQHQEPFPDLLAPKARIPRRLLGGRQAGHVLRAFWHGLCITTFSSMTTTDPDLGWWRREGTPKKGFHYIGLNGRELTAARPLARIASLVIPPAWTEVHISPDPERKVQAWGYDQAGRRQYRYSETHVARQDRRKWKRLARVGRLLPRLREATNEHLKRDRLDREKVLATVVRLMTRAFFRSGSERYAVENRTFGICTLKKKHVRIVGENVIFTYVGKGRKDQRQVVADTPLVEIIEELMALPGPRLFQYLTDHGRKKRRPVTAAAVNRYLREILGEKVTSKDLRTFGGTVRASTILADIGPARSVREAAGNVVLCCKLVAHELGNTSAICRKAYIHPAVLEEYERSGRTVETTDRRKAVRNGRVSSKEPVGHYPEESALLRFLARYG